MPLILLSFWTGDGHSQVLNMGARSLRFVMPGREPGIRGAKPVADALCRGLTLNARLRDGLNPQS